MFGLLIRFSLAGLVNTAVGYSIILVCLFAGMGDFVANAAAYAVGVMLSFILNGRYVFSAGDDVSRDVMLRFLAAFAIAYSANVAVLWLARSIVGPGNPLAQLPAMATYSLVQFTLFYRFVFPQRP